MTNTATVAGGGDVNAANNTATDATTIGARARPDDHEDPRGQLHAGPDRRDLHDHRDQRGKHADERAGDRHRHVARRSDGHGLSGIGLDLHPGHADVHAQRRPIAAGANAIPPLHADGECRGQCAGSVTNTATVAGGGDVNAGNNTATDPTTIGAGPDLTITKTHTGDFTQGQIGATYTITVTNAGNAPTSGPVTVTDTLPAGLTATALSGTGWSCTLATLTCTRSDALAAGSSFPALTLTVNVAANAGASRRQHRDGRGRRRHQPCQQHGDRRHQRHSGGSRARPEHHQISRGRFLRRPAGRDVHGDR